MGIYSKSSDAYRYMLQKFKGIVFDNIGYLISISAIIAIYCILQVKFDFAFYIGSSESGDKINEVIVNLSYSYLAGYVFYILTVKLPYWGTKRKIEKPLKTKLDRVLRKCTSSVESIYPLSDHGKIVFEEESFVEDFKNVSYFQECSIFGMKIPVIEYITAAHEENRKTITEILEYKSWLSADKISMLEQIRSSDLPLVITALYLPGLKEILDNPTSRETLARCVFKLYVLAQKVNEKD